VVLAGFGIPAEASLAASVLCGLCLIAVGLPGGLLWLSGWDIAPRSRRRAEALQQRCRVLHEYMRRMMAQRYLDKKSGTQK
jgi:hypothetical protein